MAQAKVAVRSVHFFQHVPFEGPAALGPWFSRRGYRVSATRFFEPHPTPDPDAIDWLVILGGPMGVYEESRYPWMTEEKRLIQESLERGAVIFGICLGSQLIANVLGARVYRHSQKEIGWYPVSLTSPGTQSPFLRGLEETILPFHWHGDTFDLPEGAIHLARSGCCEMQAFSHGRNILGLQFHLDSDAESVGLLLQNCGEDLAPAPWVQDRREILDGLRNLPRLYSSLDLVLGNMSGVPAGKRTEATAGKPL